MSIRVSKGTRADFDAYVDELSEMLGFRVAHGQALAHLLKSARTIALVSPDATVVGCLDDTLTKEPE